MPAPEGRFLRTRALLGCLAFLCACATQHAPPASNVPPGTISGTVTVEGGDLSGVLIVAGGSAATPSADGTFKLSEPPGAYTVTATKDAFRSDSAQVTVPSGGTVSVALNLHPLPAMAAAPVLQSFSVDPPVVAPGGSASILAVASDPSGGALTYAFSTDPGWTITPGESGMATLTAPMMADASALIHVVVSDAVGATTSGAILVRTAPNQRPILESLTAAPALLAPLGTATLTALASDPDEDTLTYAWSAPAGWTLAGSGATVTLAAPDAYAQTALVSVVVSDASGASTSGELAVATVPNQPPAILSVTAMPPLVAPGGTTQVQATAMDPDGDGLTYSWAAPAGWTIVGAGSQATVTAPEAYSQVAEISVTVTDSAGASASAQVVVWTRDNQEPQLSSLFAAQTPLPRGGSTTVTAIASDPDGDALTYTWSASPGWTLAGSGPSVTLTAPSQASATGTVTLTVSDASGAAVSGSVAVSTNPDLAPVISSVTASPTVLAPGGTARLQVIAADPEGDPLTYTWSAPSGWKLAGTGAAVTVTAPGTYGQSGLMLVTVSDGTLTTQGAAAIATASNGAPVITSVTSPNGPLLPGASGTVSVTAEDPDGDAVSLHFQSSNPAWQVSAIGGTATVRSTFQNGSSTTLTITAGDAAGATATTSVTLSTSSCAPGFMNCDGDPSNGCEAPLFSDAANCGACDVSCPALEACHTGSCVNDLVWHDEFDGSAGTSPDVSRWTFDTGNNNGWGNGELETYTSAPQNVRLDGNGHLVIEALAQQGSSGTTYTSGRIKSQGLFSHAYGRVEALIQLPFSQGLWPAFWMLGDNIGSVGWPACGEIDIMENLGREPSMVHGTIHGPGYSGTGGLSATYSLPSGEVFSTAYHLFTVDWEPNLVRWSVDGSVYEEQTFRNIPSGDTWAYNHPFFILLNLAVGGYWPGNPDGTSVFPQTMLVDYVRVHELLNTPYQNAPAGVPGMVLAVNYDEGGEGVGYHDVDPVNLGGVLRTDQGVDIEATLGGGADVGWTAAGEWLEYTIAVERSGTYSLDARVASQGQGGTFHLEVDGAVVTGELAIPDTGGWQSWQTIHQDGLALTTGIHVLRVVMDSNGPSTGSVGNFSSFSFAGH